MAMYGFTGMGLVFIPDDGNQHGGQLTILIFLHVILLFAGFISLMLYDEKTDRYS
jgi:hypothetical protein